MKARFEIGDNIMLLQKNPHAHQGWFLRNSKWFTTQRPLTMFGAANFCVFVAYWAVTVGLQAKPLSQCDFQNPDEIIQLQDYISTLFMAIIIVIVICLAFMFRKHRFKDELGFVSHFFRAAVVALVDIILYGVMSTLYKPDPSTPGALLPIITTSGYFFTACFVIISPLVVYYNRYGSKNRVQPFDSSTFTSLSAVLQHPIARERFSRFLVSEFSSGLQILFVLLSHLCDLCRKHVFLLAMRRVQNTTQPSFNKLFYSKSSS